MLPINKKITPYNLTKSKTKRRIDYIVIHYFGSLATAEQTANYFFNAQRDASAHYCVDSKSIWQCVEDNDISWHCGTTGTYFHACRNASSIGIEVKPCKSNPSTGSAADKDWYFDELTLRNTIDLVKALMAKYHIPIENVIRHYDVTHKWCPRPFCGTDINTYYQDTGDNQWLKFKARLEEEEMTQEKFEEMLNIYFEKLNTLPPADWSAPARAWIEANGIVKGDEKGQKKYKKLVTKEEVSQMIYGAVTGGKK